MRHVVRRLAAAGGAAAMVTMLMPGADASPESKWSEWSAPVNLGAGINTSFSEAAPAISRDGLTLYFVSNRPGSAGSDVYRSVRTSVLERWSKPEPLGPVVNTGASENLVAIAPDGETLFFTSSRDGGFGSNDLYVTRRTRDGIQLTLRTTDLHGTALAGSCVVIEPSPGVHPSPGGVALQPSQPLRVEAPIGVGACRFVRFVNPVTGAVLSSRVLNGNLVWSEEWLAQYRCSH